VDCFGRGHREVRSKNEGLDPYAFSIAIENGRRDAYFTEKLIDCLVTGTVPLYWGFPSVGTLFDARGILPFTTAAELDEVLAGLSFDLYRRMLPFVEENRRRVQSLELDTPGLWRRAARVLAREAEGLSPRRRPLLRSLVFGR
jgi:hypothetical protein